MNYYTGIGSRDTPKHIIQFMEMIGRYMAYSGWTLRSGAADGADLAFERGCDEKFGKKEIYLPWKGFNHSKSELHPLNYPFTEGEKQFTAQHHPAWHRCTPSARLLHQRNLRQLIGINAIHGPLVQASKFIVCWTQNAALVGGTAQALRIGTDLKIPIINLGYPKTIAEVEAMIKTIDKIVNETEQQKVKSDV